MFGRKKTMNLFNEVNDERTVVNDFQLRNTGIGYESYRPVKYRLFHKLEEEEMMPLLNEHLKRLLVGEVDEANGDMLDTCIFGAAREALPDLRRQKHNHDDTIQRLIARRAADRQDIERIRQGRQNERDDIHKHYEKICDAMSRCKEEL